jgi:thymidylate synthase
MYIAEKTLDDVLRAVLSKLLRSKNRIRPTKGSATELTGVLLKITQPRARLSRSEMKGTLFSCLGELLWYLARTNDLKLISYYLPDYKQFSDDGKTVYGGYGPRLFKMRGHNQIANIIALLKRKSHSRQAVVQLFDASDLAKKHKDIPCTCTLQFMIRRGRLLMCTYMRSNDAFLGLPHDVFAFTMLQEIVARSLQVELGTYNHAVGSLHLYKKHRSNARTYVKEGWQPTTPMPPMPTADPWSSIRKVVGAERDIRCGRKAAMSNLRLNGYWQDLVRLLQVYRCFKRQDGDEISRLKGKMSTRLYDPYIDEKKQAIGRKSAKMLRK